MTVPWVNATVEGVLAELRKIQASNPAGSGIVYAAAMGMITGLTGPHDRRPAEARMADAAAVCAALRRFEDEG